MLARLNSRKSRHACGIFTASQTLNRTWCACTLMCDALLIPACWLDDYHSPVSNVLGAHRPLRAWPGCEHKHKHKYKREHGCAPLRFRAGTVSAAARAPWSVHHNLNIAPFTSGFKMAANHTRDLGCAFISALSTRDVGCVFISALGCWVQNTSRTRKRRSMG